MLEVRLATHEAPERSLYSNSGSRLSEVLRQFSGQVTSDVSLQNQRGFLDLQVFLPVDPALDVLLDHDAARPQLVSTQLLQVRHLASSEKYLRLTKLELVGVLQTGNP